MENVTAHAKRLEDDLTSRAKFANPKLEVAAPNERRTDATKRERRDEIEPPQESANTRGASSSSAGADVDTLANDRWSQAATMTWCADWTCVTSSMNILQMCT